MRRFAPPAVGALLVAWLGASAMQAFSRGAGADIVRQWTVSQYLLARIDPYQFALDVLHARYGEADGTAQVYAIPPEVPPDLAAQLLPGLGPPEATYPPSSIAIVTALIGWLRGTAVIIGVWWCLDAALVALVIALLRRWLPTDPEGSPSAWWMFALAMLTFTPFFIAIGASQFSLLVLAALLAALHPRAGPVRAGAGFAIALVKPSVALPFAAVLAARRQWRAIAIAAAIHLSLVAIVCILVGSTPLALHVHWLGISRYFLQSMYSVQEIVNGAGLGPHSAAVSLALLSLTSCLVIWRRAAGAVELFACAAACSVYWTYHGPYDFVCLLPVLLLYAGWKPADGGAAPRLARFAKVFAAIGVIGFVTLSVASLPAVYSGGDSLTRAIRWAGRLVSLMIFVVALARIVLAGSRAPAVRPGSPDPRLAAASDPS